MNLKDLLINLLIVGAIIILLVVGITWADCSNDCNTYKYITIASGGSLIIGIILAIINYKLIPIKTKKSNIDNTFTGVVAENTNSI